MIENQKRLDAVGQGFCLAKFLDVSMHLESGHNHSCVHPRTHRIPIEEISRTPHALHNSEYKKTVRAEMLNNGRPKECGYCWNMENQGVVSDRTYFSAGHLGADPNIVQHIISQGAHADFYPKRVEVSFSTTCNFKCSYCGPEISSRWMKDLEKFGPLELDRVLFTKESIQTNQKYPIDDNEHNPYIQAFWRWLPEAYGHMRVLRVTGGEPLMSQHVFDLVDWIAEHPNPHLEFGINSNLGVPDTLFRRFVTRLAHTAKKNPVDQIVIWTSGEAAGLAAEYIRLGLDYTQWLDNIRYLLDVIPSVKVRIMTTYSALSVTSYLQFLKDIYSIKAQYPGRLILDTHTYLQYPKLMSIDILPADFLPVMQTEIDFINNHDLSSDHEKFQAERCLEYFQNRLKDPRADLASSRADFYRYFRQFDQRNGTDFVSTFPLLSGFYQLCGKDL